VSPYFGAVAGYPIPIFALALDLGLLCGLAVTVSLARRRGLPPHRVLDAAMLTLLSALAGSRAWYVVEHWADYASSPLAVLAVWEGGLALPGGVLAAAVVTPFAARFAQVSVAALADSGAVGAALAQAIGRLGCVPAGCAAGKPIDELWAGLPALMLPDASGAMAPRFPSQLVESAGELLLATVLWRVWRTRVRPGLAGWLYLAGYATMRLAAEPLRA
jgi:phosphatidylglycerol:prolipoprotein diacylglycerol transferase